MNQKRIVLILAVFLLVFNAQGISEEVEYKIYWTVLDVNKIQRANLDGSNVEDISIGLEHPLDIELDVAGGKMYWAGGDRAIQRANLDGSDIENLVTGLNTTVGIALDIAAGKVYWTDTGTNMIQRANLDGSDIENLVTNEAEHPNHIALDVASGKMYWTDYATGKIQRANLDGSDIENLVVVNEPTDLTDIALDVAGGKMYWTDYATGKIQRANLDGSDIENLVTGSFPVGIALDVAGDNMYWATQNGAKIQRANLDGSRVENVITITESKRLYGIALDLPSELTPRDQTDTRVSIAPSPVKLPALGEQLVFSINIADGMNVAGYQVTVEFDASVLDYIDSTQGDYLLDEVFFAPPKVEENRVHLVSTSLSGENSGDGSLATLTFEVIGSESLILSLSDVILSDRAGTTFHPRVEDGKVVIQIPGDVNSDGTVDILDLVRVASLFGSTGQNEADLNGDNVINIADLVLVANALSDTTAAPSVPSQTQHLLTASEVQQWLIQAQQLNLTDATSERGILFLEHLLAALTPKETSLLANYPNPFNPETWIPYQLAKPAKLTVSIYATDGTLVRTLALGHQPAGVYHDKSRAAYWDGKNELGESVASGVYFYTLKAGDFTATRKMLIRK